MAVNKSTSKKASTSEEVREKKNTKNRPDLKLGYYTTDDGLTLLRAYARDGLTQKEIATKCGVTEAAFHNFMRKYPEVKEALSKTRELVDCMVENALLRSALGFTLKESRTRISPPDKLGNRKVTTEIIEKEVAPNPTSIAIWLNNRAPEKWKRNRDNDSNLQNLGKGITVNIIKHGEQDNYTANAEVEDDEWDD